jgi:cyclic pyranopterin phosphate synthase
MKGKKLSHLDSRGRASMVDVSSREVTLRQAEAEASVLMKEQTRRLIATGRAAKGDVFAAARLAGIQAAKKTPELIPLCHPLLLGKVDVDFAFRPAAKGRAVLKIRTKARAEGQTGLEMEAMTAASVAALTVYDMCKAVDRWMTLSSVRLMSKSGGKSGTVARPGVKRAPGDKK